MSWCLPSRTTRTNQAKRLHGYLAKHGPQSTRLLAEDNIGTLVQCGGLQHALQVYHSLPQRTLCSWTALISGYATAGNSREALRTYHLMQQKGSEPNKHTFISLLKACASTFNLKEGKRIHADVLKHRYHSDLFVSTCLIDMYGKCGNIVDAKAVFDGLSQRDIASWNAMLNAYVQHGQVDNALHLYETMRQEGLSPNERTFLSVMQGCGILGAQEKGATVNGTIVKVVSVKKGKAIHADAWRKGYDIDVFVGNALVTMYGKCGSIMDAQHVFDGLDHRGVVSWNAVLSAYVQWGQADIVVQLYEQMCEEGTKANDRTFVSVLQACGMLAEEEEAVIVEGQLTKVKSLDKGKALHAYARREGYDSDVFVGSTLASMYGKCGSILDAQNSFDGLLQHDVVAWNAMIAAYVDQGQAVKGLLLYEQMREEQMSPNSRTFVSLLQACCMLAEDEQDILDGSIRVKSLGRGKAIHADAKRKGYDTDVFLGSTLVCMYGKCRSIVDAQCVFEGLSQRDVVSWNAMLAAYAQQEEAEKAMHLYSKMQEEGVSPDLRTFVSALQACGMLGEKEEDDVLDGRSTKLKSLVLGKTLHADAQKRGYGSDVFVGSTLVRMYGKCRSILDAQSVFDGLSQRDVVSWTAMLAAYVEDDQAEKALQLYEQMQERGVHCDVRTFVTALQACGMLAGKDDDVEEHGRGSRGFEVGKAIHVNVRRKGWDSDLYIGNTLINMYGKYGSIVDARKVFDGLSHHDVVSWNVMLTAYVQQGQADKALELYEQMHEEGVCPNEITLACVLQACSEIGSLTMCRTIHDTLISTGIINSSLLTNTLIHAYGRCASMEDARTIFDALPHPDAVSWNALIAGYARQGDCVASLRCYDNMQLVGVNPNGVTFLTLLSACSHAGLVERGVEFFESMSKDFGLSPGIEHYVSIVDLLGRAGHFARVQQLMSTMPMQPNLSMWSCLLGACRKHGKVMLGKQAFDCAVRLQPKYASPYVLMSSIYADAGLWDCAKEVQEGREQEGAWKKPGESWIEHKQRIHSFVVGNSQPEELYIMLEQVGSELKVVCMLHSGSRRLRNNDAVEQYDSGA